MELRESLKILELSIKEERVLLALQQGLSTPLEISRSVKVTRPAVYEIFKKLKKRGLVHSQIRNGKKSWHVVSEKELADTLYDLKKKLLKFSDGKEEVGGVTDGIVTIHRGVEAVKKELFRMFESHHDERFLTYSGFTEAVGGWADIFSVKEIGEINRLIKNKKIIAEAVFPYGWIEDNFTMFGEEWAKDYEGRTASTAYVDKKYFQNGGQMFAFKDALYLLALSDKMIIEVRHSAIQKMILSMYSFMKDKGETVDINKILRGLMEKKATS